MAKGFATIFKFIQRMALLKSSILRPASPAVPAGSACPPLGYEGEAMSAES
jgi:hypothetical protein